MERHDNVRFIIYRFYARLGNFAIAFPTNRILQRFRFSLTLGSATCVSLAVWQFKFAFDYY